MIKTKINNTAKNGITFNSSESDLKRLFFKEGFKTQEGVNFIRFKSNFDCSLALFDKKTKILKVEDFLDFNNLEDDIKRIEEQNDFVLNEINHSLIFIHNLQKGENKINHTFMNGVIYILS